MDKDVTKQENTLESNFKRYFVVLICLAAIFVIQFTVLGILYLFNKDNDALRLSLFIVSISLLIVIVIYVFLLINRYSKLFYSGLYKNTLNNYKSIVEQKKELSKYDNPNKYSELDILNKTLDDINNLYDKIIISNVKLDFSNIGLNYISLENNVVSYESFVHNYKRVIDASNNFRHAFISFQYPKTIKAFSKEEKSLFYSTIRNNYKYANLLIVDNLANNEYLLYIPQFDSLTFLKEEIEQSVSKFCVSRNTQKGYELVSCKINAVIYPYSHYDDIFTDLAFAKRQGKDAFVYIPDKPKLSENLVMSESRNISIISKVLEKLAASENKKHSFDELSAKVEELFNSICNYFQFDLAGVVLLNEYENIYQNHFAYGQKNEKGALIPSDFVNALKKHSDKDGTLYFSNRKNVSQEIGRHVDRFGIESANYYVFSSDGKVDGFIYFAKNKPTSFDSYIRESLLIYSFYISNYIYRINSMKDDYFRLTQLHDILKITGCALYSVNSRDYSIISYSPELKQLLPSIEVGQKCYEALCGKSKRCEKCPLRSGRKVTNTIKNIKFESSLALTRPGSVETSILLYPVEDNNQLTRERYDQDLLVKSYYSFFEALKDSFMISERGFILAMNIDNNEQLVQSLPSEKYNSYLRAFFNDVNSIDSKTKFDLYLLNNNSFALIIPNSTNNDVIDIAEKIYNFSKKNYHNTKELTYSLNLSYFVIAYPFGYQNANDYAKFLKVNSVSHEDLFNKDYIFVNESKYARSASHQNYLIGVLDSSISANTFNVKLQPVVNKTKRNIVSSELLFRITDINRGGELSTFEVINAAASAKKISIITSLILDYLERLFTEYSKNLVKKYELKRFGINVDYSFFEDEGFFNKFMELKEKYKLTDDMIQFEISEKEIAKHIANIKPLISKIKSTNTFIVCDNYTGESLSLEQISQLGFDGVKISFKLTSQIEHNQTTYEGLQALIETASKYKLEFTVVGVENANQFKLLSNIPYDFNIQGYYFYYPSNEHELMNALSKKVS